ncbi:class II aldolase/adducin family protein [Nocardioides sp. YIM 152315]|uniref:class II aldolase/adducin family protein n=1 Tax=Nocardioides sp. YIM 152315 TaxID=3031760 RepID=UPI0023DC4229|nr:class II aldolase/adducin family protein [Nocardioides sp. YIM 152315]MDF1604905.1 class II aldolase/adducin family protein [Nocardioides sp. YIM 152315]
MLGERRDPQLVGEREDVVLGRADERAARLDHGGAGAQLVVEHAPADPVARLDEENVVAAVGQVAGRDQPGDAAADHDGVDVAGQRALQGAGRDRGVEPVGGGRQRAEGGAPQQQPTGQDWWPMSAPRGRADAVPTMRRPVGYAEARLPLRSAHDLSDQRRRGAAVAAGSAPPDLTALRTEVAEAALRLAEVGLLAGAAGNVSARRGGLVAVTGSGIVLARCRLEDVTVVDLDGAVVAGDLTPTSELDLHIGVYADHAADRVAAIVHTHAPYCTAIACVLDELPVIHYQQLLLGGAVRVAPYATFGTEELAGHVRAALVGRKAALMASHGAVAIGRHLDEAVENAYLLEWLAALHHRATALGTPRALSDDQQAAVVMAAMVRNYGPLGEG